MTSFTFEELTPKQYNSDLYIKDHLIEHGWAVADIPHFRPKRYEKKFFDYLESCHETFDRNTPETWVREHLPYSGDKGIFKHYLGHTHWQWEIREACVSVFNEVWDTPETGLVCSYDGGCFLAPQPTKQRYRHWFHTDQDRVTALELLEHGTIRGQTLPNNEAYSYASIQGVVCLTPAGPDDGGLVIIEGSHKHFYKYLKKDPEIGVKWKVWDLDDRLNNLPKVKVCAEPGQIILFDARTLHCNIPPKSNQHRMCTYVAMTPRNFSTRTELKLHRDYYHHCLMTGHNTYGNWFKPVKDQPPSYAKNVNLPRVIEHANLSRTQYQLV